MIATSHQASRAAGVLAVVLVLNACGGGASTASSGASVISATPSPASTPQTLAVGQTIGFPATAAAVDTLNGTAITPIVESRGQLSSGTIVDVVGFGSRDSAGAPKVLRQIAFNIEGSTPASLRVFLDSTSRPTYVATDNGSVTFGWLSSTQGVATFVSASGQVESAHSFAVGSDGSVSIDGVARSSLTPQGLSHRLNASGEASMFFQGAVLAIGIIATAEISIPAALVLSAAGIAFSPQLQTYLSGGLTSLINALSNTVANFGTPVSGNYESPSSTEIADSSSFAISPDSDIPLVGKRSIASGTTYNESVTFSATTMTAVQISNFQGIGSVQTQAVLPSSAFGTISTQSVTGQSLPDSFYIVVQSQNASAITQTITLSSPSVTCVNPCPAGVTTTNYLEISVRNASSEQTAINVVLAWLMNSAAQASAANAAIYGVLAQ